MVDTAPKFEALTFLFYTKWISVVNKTGKNKTKQKKETKKDIGVLSTYGLDREKKGEGEQALPDFNLKAGRCLLDVDSWEVKYNSVKNKVSCHPRKKERERERNTDRDRDREMLTIAWDF